MGKTAYIDLTTGAMVVEPTDADALRQFLGGRGLGAKLLYDRVGPEVEPLSPDNALIFTTGLLSGTPWPSSSRLHVTFKSPLTGVYGYANSGGAFGPELRHAGWDALVIVGRASRPVVLVVGDTDLKLVEAADLWGRSPTETQRALLGETPAASAGRVACIGLAGENLVRLAAIMTDIDRAAARGGPGAVMGSKNLKAIHVRASKRPPLSAELKTAAREASAKLSADRHLDGLRQSGTLILMDSKNAGGDQPAKNHQFVQVPYIDQVNAKAFDTYTVRRRACYACPIKCSRELTVSQGRFATEVEGAEYETTNALGPMCWVSDPEAILFANRLCNDYGLDTISTGVTIAFAMELHEKGLLSDAELSLEWGDVDSVIGLVKQIAHRQGLGNILAEGTRRAAEQIGPAAQPYAMQVKGMELPRQEPRFAKGFGLGHSTSNRGADHLYGMAALDLAGAWDVARQLFPADIVPELMDPANEKYKPDLVVYGEHFCALTDALGLCKFTTVEEYSLLASDLAPGVSAVVGHLVTGQELLLAGERIVNLERLYNVRHGLSRADDHLPRRFTEEAAPLYDFQRDPQTHALVRSPEPLRYGLLHDFEAMLDRYYALRGWDRNGRPRRETLQRLGLADEAASLELSA
jgi:aldehyde:ferredoxin oxidoreductase